MSEPTPGALSPGQIFHGRYEIVRCIRSGGMGAVYECIHLKTRKHRALKVMLPQILADAGMRDRFELEARVTADIESEHIVETFDAGIDDATGAPFLVMELLRGEDLGSILKRRGPLPANETVVLLAQAALALDKTHAAGVVHRDLKPDNLYVTIRDDGSPRLKILDFGIAKVVADVGQTVHQTAMIGTPLYMSYEQILGEGTIGPRADVYAMGHIAFALLAGGSYWADEQKNSPAIYTFFGKVMAGAPEAPTVRAARRGVPLPPAFDAWFARATARAASDRFDGASTLVHELAVVLGVSTPRLALLPFLPLDSRTSAPLLPEPAPLLAERTTAAEPSGASAPTVSEGTTVVASSKSVASTSKRSRLPLMVAGIGALGLLVVGLWSRRPRLTSSTASTVSTVAITPTVMTSPPELAPAPTSSLAPGPSLPADVPTANASTSVPEPAPASTPSVASGLPSSPNVPNPTGSAPVLQHPQIAPAKSMPPAKVCEPPYVINSAGHRVMKPQCL